MKYQIYLIKTHRINLTNLFMSTMIVSEGNRVYETCRYDLINGKFFELDVGNMVKNFSDDPVNYFRYLDWSDLIPKLETVISVAQQQNQFLIFGNHDSAQIHKLKNYFGDRIFTIGINYQESLYQRLLRDIAENHIHLIEHDKLAGGESHHSLSQIWTREQMVNHYMQCFDQISLIPKSSHIDCEYNIDVADFFDETLFKAHFDNIGLPLSPTAIQYYNTWRSSSL